MKFEVRIFLENAIKKDTGKKKVPAIEKEIVITGNILVSNGHAVNFVGLILQVFVMQTVSTKLAYVNLYHGFMDQLVDNLKAIQRNNCQSIENIMS